jgi:hypothetical protein
MRLLAGAAAASLAAIALAACGGQAGDLMSIEVSGGPTGESHTLVVSGDGRGSCDRGALESLPSDRVITARELEREVGDLARRAAEYAQRPGARRYDLSTSSGVVRWSSGTPGLPKELPKAELLALELERQLCR